MRRHSPGRPVRDRKVGKRGSGGFSQTNDVLARAACDFKDCARRRQDIAKDIKNEIAITHCRRRVLAVISHLPRTFGLASARLAPGASASFAIELGRVHCRGFAWLDLRRLWHAPPPCHCCVIVRTTRAGLVQRHDHASGDRLRLRLAMNRSSARFVGLFERSAPWPLAR